MTRFSYNTKSLSGRLETFFIMLSICIALVVYIVYMQTLDWSEDSVGERRLLIEQKYAIERFKSGEQGILVIDRLTTAYNNLALVPDKYAQKVKENDSFRGEVGEYPNAKFLNVDRYYDEKSDQLKPIILLMDFDQLELNRQDIIHGALYVLGLLISLLFIFKRLLSLLSRRLIDPLNHIENQLSRQVQGVDKPFECEPEAAVEFQHLITELNRYRDENKQLLKREQAFSRYASHELRTPLTIIQGANSLLDKKASDPFLCKQIVRIDTATKQMKMMVDALLSIVRYEKNPTDTVLRRLTNEELQLLIESTVQNYPDKQIIVNTNVTSEPLIQATEPVIQMLIGNLLRNAIEATEQGNIEITLNESILSIKDNGPGLNQTNPAGHGLGLLIIEDLCQKYAWHFDLKNNTNSLGCEATIRFNKSTQLGIDKIISD